LEQWGSRPRPRVSLRHPGGPSDGGPVAGRVLPRPAGEAEPAPQPAAEAAPPRRPGAAAGSREPDGARGGGDARVLRGTAGISPARAEDWRGRGGGGRLAERQPDGPRDRDHARRHGRPGPVPPPDLLVRVPAAP